MPLAQKTISRKEFKRRCDEAAMAVLEEMTDTELLQYADRGDPVTRMLCERLEANRNYLRVALNRIAAECLL
jgi:hypothetical protein